MALVYKVLSRSEWSAAERDGEFRGSEVDRRDGFIHLSAGDQLEKTVMLWFADRDDLMLAAIEDGTIVDVCGVKVGGIWGNYSPRSWVEPHNVLYHRNGGSSPRTAMHICQQSVRSLLSQRQSKMDVLVTHDTARCTLPLKFAGQPMDPEIKEILGLRQSEESNGCPAFDEILDVFKPAYYFFGHLHHYAEGWHGPTKTTCLDALGYSENWCKVVTIGEQENDSLFGGELDKAA